MRVLGIDPGTLTMGYGVVEDEGEEPRLIDSGALTCSSHTPLAERLGTLYQGLMQVISRHQPQEVAIEEPFVAKNARSALAVGRAQAIAILAAGNHGLPVYTYTPTQIKRAVAGYGVSRKEQVQEMVRVQLNLSSPPQPDDVADALAVALCHLRQVHWAKLVAQQEEP